MRSLFKIKIDQKRVYGLDILRALAILFVVIGHGRYMLPEKLGILHDVFVFDGVSIFFVLSGFLIGGILIKIIEKGDFTLKVLADFWKRRWFRTLPNYFLVLTFITCYYVIADLKLDFNDLRWYFIFSQNLFSEHPSFFPEAWSLSIEEWFYILVPSIIFILARYFKVDSRKAISYTAFSLVVLVLLFRGIRFYQLENEDIWSWDNTFRKQVITRLDSLMYGVIGAYLNFYHNEKWKSHRKILFLVGITIFAIMKAISLFKIFSIDSFYNCVLSFSLTSFATLALLPLMSNFVTGKGKIYKILSVISLISYSMYLINLTIVHSIIIPSIPWEDLTSWKSFNLILRYISFWGMTILGSVLIYKYFEVPMTSLRDKRFNLFKS